jgi:hypothetical protein
MRRSAAVSLVGLALFAVPAAAGTTGRFEVHVRAQPTLVNMAALVRTRLVVYSIASSGRVLSDARTFRLVAVSPLGERLPLGLRHVGRGTWSGAIRPRVAGRWVIRVSNWPGAGPVPSVAVHVRGAASLPEP